MRELEASGGIGRRFGAVWLGPLDRSLLGRGPGQGGDEGWAEVGDQLACDLVEVRPLPAAPVCGVVRHVYSSASSGRVRGVPASRLPARALPGMKGVSPASSRAGTPAGRSALATEVIDVTARPIQNR